MSEDFEFFWLSVAGATAYRLCRRNETKPSATIYEGHENKFSFSEDDLAASGKDAAVRVEVKLPENADYVTLVPWQPLLPAQGGIIVTAPDMAGAPAWQIILRDDTDQCVLIDRMATRRDFAIDSTALPATHRMRLRFYFWDWRAKKWRNLGGHVRFVPPGGPDELSAPAIAPRPVRPPPEEEIWHPDIVSADAPLAPAEILVTAPEPLLHQSFGGHDLIIEALNFPIGTSVFLSHAAPRPGAPDGIVTGADRRLPVLYLSRTLGTTWAALIAKKCEQPFRRHFLTFSGRHIVQSDAPVETLTLDGDGDVLARTKTSEEPWHGACSIDQNSLGTIMFAEYRATRDAIGGALNVWRSRDDGLTWTVALAQPGRSQARTEGEIRHFHTCQADPHVAGRWYLTSGDATHECGLWISDDDGDNWTRVFPTVEGEGDIRQGERQRLLRQTSFAIGEKDLIWATDDNVNGGCSTLVRCDKNGARLEILARLGINLSRSFVRVGAGLAVAVSESKKDTASASAFLLDKDGHPLGEATLKNLSGKGTGFTYSLASRDAVQGVFFTPTDGAILTERTTVLRWRLSEAGMARQRKPKPFAVVGKTPVNWFPSDFKPHDDDLLVLLRPQRVGGISLRNLICFIQGIEAMYAYRMTPGYKHWPELEEADLAGYRTYTGHAKFVDKAFTRRCLYLGLVREPAQRLVSLYRYIRARTNHTYWEMAQDGDIEKFYRAVYALQPGYVSNLQAEFICGAPDGKLACEIVAERYFGAAPLEYLDQFVAAAARTLQWPPGRMRHVNKAQSAADFPVTEGFLEFARQINQEDYRLYNFVREAWEQRLSSGSSFNPPDLIASDDQTDLQVTM